MFLQTIDTNRLFHASIPQVPMGRYSHFVVLRETNSFPLFQTDQQLNFARVNAGRAVNGENPSVISRIVMFKRKQTTPERLTGRELLRRYNFVSEDSADTDNYCEYNSAKFCKRCPDCIYYGFAIGQEGSERSKVMNDSAFSLSNYDESHEAMTFNAPYEHGTMSKSGETKHSFGEQDHVLPQMFFPSVITLRDPTEAEFLYVFNNILRTKRYGAQTTRTGTLENRIAAVIFSDGEIFSNLKLTQTLYDMLEKDDDGQVNKGPYQAATLVQNIEDSLPTLLQEDHVTTHLSLTGDNLDALIEEVNTLVTNEDTLVEVLQQAYTESQNYYSRYGAGAKPERKNSKGKQDEK
jgi:CRISPR-associated protein Csc2